MRILFYVFNFIFIPLGLFSQVNYSIASLKPALDSSAYKEWSSVSNASISGNGEYVAYFIDNLPLGKSTLTVKGTEKRWEMNFIDGNGLKFTSDSRYSLFKIGNDTLVVLQLGKSIERKIPEVDWFDVSKYSEGKWLVYKAKNRDSVCLINLKTHKEYLFSSDQNFILSKNGETLLLQNKAVENGSVVYFLKWIDLKSLNTFDIWKGEGLVKVVMNDDGSRTAFLTNDTSREKKSIWYASFPKKHSKVFSRRILTDSIGCIINDLHAFSGNDDYILLDIRKVDNPSKDSSNSTVHVWSYMDKRLLSQQLTEKGYIHDYPAVINVTNFQFDKVTGDYEYIVGKNRLNNIYLITKLNGGDGSEFRWNDSSQSSYYLRDLKTNQIVNLKLRGRYPLWISPGGKFVIYYDKDSAAYFSYKVDCGQYRNITRSIKSSFISSYWDDGDPYPRGIAAWGKDDKSLLIYDRFDIWLIDPLANSEAINLTNGFGSSNNIIFSLGLSEYTSTPILRSQRLILNALDLKTKENGFFEVVGRNKDPMKLTMGNYVYQLIDNPFVQYSCAHYPIKASLNDRFVLFRMSATEAPNYFYTVDFKKFVPLSSVEPQSKYNWYTTQLVSWRQSNGQLLQGVLYKPENFDSTKKYPVIIHYYEKKSFSLNEYLYPSDITNGCNINVPTYVSNGYLVFTPDINFIIGDPMLSAFNSVVSATEYLSRFSFVNKKRIGIGGCSFAGIQTNYLVTHTNLYAAAYSASSMSDLVSAYGSLFGGSVSLQSFFEQGGQGRMGGTLWENKEKYIRNSPIFNVDKVVTPILIMHTTSDPIAPFPQAIEFFTALRRLGKRSWMLEYTQGRHGVDGASARDFAIRLKQFFDHYLKDMPPPRWMTRIAPVAQNGIKDGLLLDMDIKTPGKSLLDK